MGSIHLPSPHTKRLPVHQANWYIELAEAGSGVRVRQTHQSPHRQIDYRVTDTPTLGTFLALGKSVPTAANKTLC